MTKNINHVLLTLLIILISACSSTPEKPKPYWLQTANNFIGKGVQLYNQQQYSASAVEFARALNTYQRFDYVKGMADSYLNLAKSEIAQNNILRAQAYIHPLKELIEDNHFKSMSVHVDIMHSSIAINLTEYNQAVNILTKHLDNNGEKKANLAESAYMALLINRVKIAIITNVDASKWVAVYEAKKTSKYFYRARLLRFKGEIANRSNKIDMLNQYFSAALDLYRNQANPKAVLSTLKEWGVALKNNKEFKDAAKRFESVYTVSKSSANELEASKALDILLSIYKSLNNDKSVEKIKHLISEAMLLQGQK